MFGCSDEKLKCARDSGCSVSPTRLSPLSCWTPSSPSPSPSPFPSLQYKMRDKGGDCSTSLQPCLARPVDSDLSTESSMSWTFYHMSRVQVRRANFIAVMV
jgi:hypothetical protein